MPHQFLRRALESGGRFAVAFLFTLAAAALRAALTPLLGSSVPFLTFYPAVVLAAAHLGPGPALFALALSSLTAQFLYLTPFNDLRVQSAGDAVSLLFFIVFSAFLIHLVTDRRRQLTFARERLQQVEEERRQRQDAEAREAETRRWATDTLASIGDAVICTDVDGRVTYLNAVAQELTGWTHQDALGTPLHAVFNIINDETREPAPNPIGRILREGQVLGLANHTVLINRHGPEYPIDDSGAPIRGPDQQIAGAVIVFRDISARKRMEDDLRRTAAELTRSNDDLRMYAHAISHDLQEPLRTITACAQLLARKYQPLSAPEDRDLFTLIVEGGQRMHRLIRDLLAYSQTVTLGTNTFSPVRLGDVVQWATGNLADSIAATGARITYDSLPTITADHVQLVQIFQNLIGNAIKYRGEQPPEIAIDARSDDAHWILTVRDNGIGIPDGQHARVFELFRRANSTTAGSGIGLAICKRIVERFGGSIWAEPNVPGPGTTFYFTLLRDPAHIVPPGGVGAERV
jgi:PAS domain S-box-containing protein